MDNIPALDRNLSANSSPIRPTLKYGRRVLSTRLPLPVQHQLLQYIQHLLDSMCLSFGQIWCPEEMAKRGWNEAWSLELHRWVSFLSRDGIKRLPPVALQVAPDTDHKALFTKVAEIRHLAIHRCAIDFQCVIDCLNAGHQFAAIHQDATVHAGILSLAGCVSEVQRTCLDSSELDPIRQQQVTQVHVARADASTQNQQQLTDAGQRIERPLRSRPDVSVAESVKGSGEFSNSSDSSDIESILFAAERQQLPDGKG